jgi:AraC family transcriptional regulator
MNARLSTATPVFGETVRRKLSMFQMQTINTESYSLLAGLPWGQPPQRRNVEKDGFRRGNRSGASLSDLSMVHPETVVASSQDLGWHNIRVLQVCHSYGDMDVPPLENHCMIVQLEPSLHVSASIGGHDFDGSLSWGDIAIIPAGAHSRWRWHNSNSHDALHIYLHPLFLQKTTEMCDLNQAEIAIGPQLALRDEQLSHIAMSLLCELKEENVMGSLYAGSVASLLAMQLVRRYSSLNDVRIRRGGMAPHKLREAIKFIGDNLEQEQDIALAVVAEKVGMSRYHFSRVFKQSMGLSPISYIAQQRIERAKKLLAETDVPIAEIALRTGFSGQSHFTTSFRRLMGLTPRSFRRGI